MEENMLTGKGRIRRKTYWLRWLFVFLIQLILNLALSHAPQASGLSLALSIILSIYLIIQGIKRMHDTDHSGWYILVPIYNLILLFTDGTWGPNRFGDDPKERPGIEGQENEDGNISLEKGLYPESSNDYSKVAKAVFALVIADVSVVVFWTLVNLYAQGNTDFYMDMSIIITVCSVLSSILIPVLGAIYTPNRSHRTLFIICALAIFVFRIVEEFI